MNIANKNIQRLVIIKLMVLFFLPLVNAENIFSPLNNLTQNQNERQEFELSNSQIRSRVADDEARNTGSQHLKLRLNEHHIVFVYQKNFQ